jgi:membrane associated rhomboid family serine protease
VGVHCVECYAQDRSKARKIHNLLGAPVRGNWPVLTITAIALCVLVYIAQVAGGDGLMGGGRIGSVSRDLGLIPVVVADQPYRLFTAAFVHWGVLHLALNMYALWVVGSVVEQAVGRWRFAVLFLSSAVAGNVAVQLYFRFFEWNPNSPLQSVSITGGASGAVFGLFGAVLVILLRLGRDTRGIIAVIALNLVLSFSLVGISWQGHVGGLIVGTLLALVYAYAPRTKRRAYAWFAAVGATVLLVALAWLGMNLPPRTSFSVAQGPSGLVSTSYPQGVDLTVDKPGQAVD